MIAKKLIIKFILLVIVFASFFYLGGVANKRAMEKKTIIYQTIGNNKHIDKPYKKDGMNCIDSYEIAASFCSAFPVKAVHK